MKTSLSTFAVLALLFAPGLSSAQTAQTCAAGSCPMQQPAASCPKTADGANCPNAGDCANCPKAKDCPLMGAKRQQRVSPAWRAARSRLSRRGVVFPAAPTAHRQPCVSGTCPA